MSIIIGKIDNKFWSNSEYKFPNGFPVYSEQEELKDVEPNMNNFVTGTVYLFGDKWNHCIYSGAYYSLYILEVIDEERKFYTYRLERDFWFDVLKLRPSVVGDLITSNNDDLLIKNLNRTVAAIDNPGRVITINFHNVTFDGRKNLDFKTADNEIPQVILSLEDFNRFVASADCVFLRKGKLIDKAFYSGNRNPAVFIVDILKPSITVLGGKNILRNKVNEFVRNIPKTSKSQLKLAKVSFTGNNAGSPLNGKYCITQKVEGIASAAESETYRIKTIDLSGLTDIIPLNIHNLQELTPYTNLLEGPKSGLFTSVDKQEEYKNFFAKVSRKAYIPVCASSDRRPESPVESFGFDGNWGNVKNPQKITGEYGGVKKEEFLWWVDNLNFAIQKTVPEPVTPGASQAGIPVRWVQIEWNDRNKTISKFPRPWSGGEIFPDLENNQLVPFGFLMYGINRSRFLGYLFEYKGSKPTSKIEYFNGIKKDFIEHYREEGAGWSKLTDGLKRTKKSDEFLKFYLDTQKLTMMGFLPGTLYSSAFYGNTTTFTFPSYLYSDLGGTYVMTNYKYYVPEIMASDMFRQDGSHAEVTPFRKDRFSGYQEYRDTKFRKLLNFGSFDLPDDLQIEEGDYLFNDLEYEIRTRFITNLGKEKGKAWADFADRENNDALKRARGKFVWEFVSQMRLEDFVTDDPASGVLKLDPNQQVFALCTTLHGNIDVRSIQTFNKTLTLSNQFNEIVESVEGTKSTNLTFTLFKKLSEPLMSDIGEYRITKELKAKLIKSFYKAHGYKVIGEGEVFGNGFTEADFAESCQEQYLFDLKGTDGYCFITKGKISLICKDEKILEVSSQNLNSLNYAENEGLELSPIEKINQRTRLQFYTAPYYLNGKTNFNEDDRIFLYSEAISPTPQQTNFEQHFLKLETGFDLIGYENISVPKVIDKALNPADTVQMQQLHMNVVRDQYLYQIDQDKLALATKRYEESIKRAQIELDNQRTQSLLSLGATVLTAGVGVGLASKLYKPSKLISGRNPKYPTNLPPGAGPGPVVNEEGEKIYPRNVRWTKGKFIKTPKILAGTSGVASMLKTAQNLYMDGAIRFPERERQIGVDKQLGAEDLGISSLSINTSHMDRQITMQNQLNQLTNVYHNPYINEREILEKYKEKKDGHGKTLKDIHLVVFVPTEEQLVALKSFKEEFGVMCDIPDIEINFYEGMNPDVIRYRNLDDRAIRGIDNLIIREFLRAHLMAGIKIIKTRTDTYQLLTGDEYRKIITRLNDDINQKENSITDLQKQIETIENRLNNINTQLNEKTQELEAKKQESENNKQRITTLEGEKAKLQNDYDEDKKRLDWNRRELAKKRKELEEANKQKTAIDTEKNNLKTQLDQKIKECSDIKTNLENEIKKHKIDKEEAEQKWDDCKRDYLNEKSAKDRLTKEKEELTKQKAEITKQKELLETQKADIERQLRECISSKDTLTKEKADIQKKFEDCKKNRQQQKTQLEARIKELEAQKGTATPAVKTAEQLKEECEILKDAFGPGYYLDIGVYSRDSKLNKLIITILESLKWLRREGLDAKLGTKYKVMRPVFDQLMKFEEIPIVEKGEGAMNSEGGSLFMKYPEGTDIDTIRGGIGQEESNKITETILYWIAYIYGMHDLGRNMETLPTAHGIKAILDDINGLVYKAKNELSEELKTDAELEHMFKHIYPGKCLDLYQDLFGNPNIAVAKRKFIEEFDCSTSPGIPLEEFIRYFKTTQIGIEEAEVEEDDFIPTYEVDTSEGKKTFTLSTDKQKITVGIAPLARFGETEFLTSFPGLQKRDAKDRYRQREWNNLNCSFVYLRMYQGHLRGAVGKEQGLYIGVVEKDLIKQVQERRNYLGKNRKSLRIPDDVEEVKFTAFGPGIKGGNARYVVFGDVADTGERVTEEIAEHYEFNLLKIFGEKYVLDAATLLGIMITNRLDVTLKEDNKKKGGIKIDKKLVDKTAMEKNLPELTKFIFGRGDDRGTRFELPYFEFANPISLLNYIGRQIKLNLDSLENPYGPEYSKTSDIDFAKGLNEIYERNKT